MRKTLVIVLACLVPAAGQAQVTYKPGEGWPGTKPVETVPEFRTDRGDFEEALAVYQAGDSRRAMALADDVVATYQTGPWVEHAMLLKARAWFRMSDLAAAETQLDLMEKRFPGTTLGAEMSDLRFAIANARIAAGKTSGVKALEKMIETDPYGPRSDEAQFTLAMRYFDRKNWVEAAESFAVILEQYPDSRYREDAMFLRAKASYLDNTGPQRDPLPFEEARQVLLEYLKEFPNGKNAKEASGLLERANNALAQKLFLVGEFYQSGKHPRAAERYYGAVVMKYPKSPWAKRARAQLPYGWEPPATPETTETPTAEETPAATEKPAAPETKPGPPGEGRTDVEPAPETPAPEKPPTETPHAPD